MWEETEGTEPASPLWRSEDEELWASTFLLRVSLCFMKGFMGLACRTWTWATNSSTFTVFIWKEGQVLPIHSVQFSFTFPKWMWIYKSKSVLCGVLQGKVNGRLRNWVSHFNMTDLGRKNHCKLRHQKVQRLRWKWNFIVPWWCIGTSIPLHFYQVGIPLGCFWLDYWANLKVWVILSVTLMGESEPQGSLTAFLKQGIFLSISPSCLLFPTILIRQW